MEQKEQVTVKENLDTYDSIVFDYLARQFFEEKTVVEVSNKELVSQICHVLNKGDDEKPQSKTIGAILRNHNLLNKPENIGRRGEGESTSYVITKKEFLDMMKRFGYHNIISKMQNPFSNASNSSNASKLFEGNEANEGNEGNSSISKIELFISEFDKKADLRGDVAKSDAIALAESLDFPDSKECINRFLRDGILIEWKPGISRRK